MKDYSKMKKLMIALVVLAMAACAHAATVNWSVNVMQSSPSTTVGSNWLVQLYTSDVEYSYDAAKAGTITTWQTGASVAAGTTYRAYGSGTQDNSTTKSYYMVIYDAATVADAKNWIKSGNVSVTIGDAGASGSAAFGAMNGTTTANKFLNSSWQNVPEPTSAMLLLLGVAGLALKRKQK